MKLLLTLVLSALFVIPNNTQLQDDFEKLNLSSENYLLYSINADEILIEKNANKEVKIASMQKLLTTITAIELLEDTDLNTYITAEPIVFQGISNASLADLRVHEQYRIIDVLYGILLPSGADATRLISLYLTGTPEGLVDAMNQKAQEIGMLDTHIVNTSGLDAQGQHATLHDLLRLVQYVQNNELFMEIFSTQSYTFVENGIRYEYENAILTEASDKNFNYIHSAKSGYTTLAGFNLISIAGKDDLEYIFISSKAEVNYIEHTSLTDAIKVYDYLFNTYSLTTYPSEIFDVSVNIKNRFADYTLTFDESMEAIIHEEFDLNKLTVDYVFDESALVAPIDKDTKIGVRNIYYNEILLETTDVYTQEDIPKDLLFKTLDVLRWVFLVFVGMVGVLVIYRKSQTRKHRKHYRY